MSPCRARLSPCSPPVLIAALSAAILLVGCMSRARVEYIVHSRDAPGVDERITALTPAHWDYMDGFADRLVARGPTLSADGEQHTGSVHIVALADADAARSFVADEPYNRAGLYAEHAIVRFVNLLGRTMWERPPAPDVPQSTFVIARWPAIPAGEATIRAARDAVRARPDTWIFLGLLVTEDGGRCVGVAAAADASAHDAEVALRGVLRALQQERALAEIHRWQRGGRR